MECMMKEARNIKMMKASSAVTEREKKITGK